MIQTNGNLIVFAGAILILVMIVTWFVLMAKLFNRLSARHPAIYEAMGRPTLFLRNNIGNSLMTAKFLFLREYRNLGDPALNKLCNLMLGFFVAYVAVFAWFIHYANSLPMHAA